MSAPPDDVVHRIHDLYLTEVVEGLKLCPFARRSREQGCVHRPIVRCEGEDPSPSAAARTLVDVASAHADAEIVLITFIGDSPRLATPEGLDGFVREVRVAYAAAQGAPRPFFMVGFHRDSGRVADGDTPPKLTPDSLVPLLRRTPDPVIQCVDTGTLERARAIAQAAAHDRMVAELTALNPAMRAIAERSVASDSQLSADIARANYNAVATGEGRAELERKIAEIVRIRDASG
ncbi:MAG: hypothetical protein JKY37_33610 [Nannocystaceae bacterium]|nr:hypothetical protein [Nannocystaceae bacterium]